MWYELHARLVSQWQCRWVRVEKRRDERQSDQERDHDHEEPEQDLDRVVDIPLVPALVSIGFHGWYTGAIR
jgi:hypothetical protein